MGQLGAAEFQAQVEISQVFLSKASGKLVSITKGVSVQLLNNFFEERVSHRCALESKGCPESPVKAACSLKLIAQVHSYRAPSNMAVSTHLSCPNEVFVHSLALNQFPKAVLIRERVDNLAFASTLDKIIKER